MEYRVISIGALSRHELWNETQATRTAHATTLLIRTGKRNILVDPGLPAQAVTARLQERSGLSPEQITDVFLTNFRPAHRRGLNAFEHAVWHIHEPEREIVGKMLIEQFRHTADPATRDLIQQDIALLQRCKVAADHLADQVDLFPLPGFTPGNCGLLLLQANSTALVASDAIATLEHLEKGQVLRGAYDLEQARESFKEAVEIADVIIPGHDNLLLNPTRRPM